MENFKLINHYVKSSSYFINGLSDDMDQDVVPLEIKIDGDVFMPDENVNSNSIIVVFNLKIGEEKEYMSLRLQTVSLFNICNNVQDINKQMVEKECLPIAFSYLKGTLESITDAYEINSISLPTLDFQNIV